MTQITLPNGVNFAGANSWSSVYTNDAACVTVLNGDLRNDNFAADAAIALSKLASVNNSSYRTILQATGILGSGTATMPVVGTAAASTTPPASRYIEPTDYAVTSLTTYFRLQALVYTNATAPTISFQFDLCPITVAGGADAIAWSAGTSLATVTITTPSASSVTMSTSSDFTLATAGAYGIKFTPGATLPTNAAVSVQAQLQVRNT